MILQCSVHNRRTELDERGEKASLLDDWDIAVDGINPMQAC